jgi:DNA-binding NtrC family response regulator
MREGKLREDLLYRLSVFPIHMPPLRERGDDVDLLADFFLTQLNEQTESEKGFSDDARETLRAYPWPGNVRELKNVVHRAFIMADDEVDAACLPSRMRGGAGGARNLSLAVGTSIADAERRLILATLEQQAGDKKRTADLLGVSLKTLYNRLNAYKEAGESIPEMGVDDAGDDDG